LWAMAATERPAPPEERPAEAAPPAVARDMVAMKGESGGLECGMYEKDGCRVVAVIEDNVEYLASCLQYSQ